MKNLNYYLERTEETKFEQFDFVISDDILLSLKDNVLDAFKRFSNDNKNVDDQLFFDKLFPLLRAELER